MKPLNLLTVFTRPSMFAAAMSVAVVFAFVSSASAEEKKFDALGGVTAEALTPAAMDAIQGTGRVSVCILPCGTLGSFPLAGPIDNNGPWDIWVDISVRGRGAVLRIPAAQND